MSHRWPASPWPARSCALVLMASRSASVVDTMFTNHAHRAPREIDRERLLERFLQYVRIPTAANPATDELSQ